MATIIKRGTSYQQPTGLSVRTSSLQLDDFSGRADRYLHSVQERAAQIVQEAHREAEQIRRQAEEAGREAATRAAQQVLDQKVARQMESLLPALRQAIASVADAKQEWLRYWERCAVRLASAIASRVIRQEIRQQPSISEGLIREALELAAGAGEIQLHLNPQDYKSLASNVAALAEEFAHFSPAQVVADPTVELGSCRLTTKFGEIDQQFRSQLERIEEELVGDE